MQYLNKFLKVTKHSEILHNRKFWAWLDIIFNQVDKDRLKEFGPDRACAEWLLRNGASVKWTKTSELLKDYNQLPKEGDTMYIQEIDASGSSIMHYGFPYLQQCNYCEKMILHDCSYMTDKALRVLSKCSPPKLIDLEVSKCYNITDNGLLYLQSLASLKHLKLYDLPYVKDEEKVRNLLQNNLRQCEIIYEPHAKPK